MKITLGNKVGNVSNINRVGTRKAYTQDCSNINAAVNFAYVQTIHFGERMIVIAGNSYMNKVYHIAQESDTVSKFTGMANEMKVVVVETNGDVFYAVAN